MAEIIASGNATSAGVGSAGIATYQVITPTGPGNIDPPFFTLFDPNDFTFTPVTSAQPGQQIWLNAGNWTPESSLDGQDLFLISGWTQGGGYEGVEALPSDSYVDITEAMVGKYLVASVTEVSTGTIYTSPLAFQITSGSTPPPGPSAADDLTNAYESLVGGALLRGQTLTGGPVYAALFTADPGEAGDTTSEVSASTYQRVAITFGPPTTDGQFANDAECLFPETGADAWGTVTHVAIMTSQGGGAMIMNMPLNSPVAVAAGEQLRINPGALTVSFS